VKWKLVAFASDHADGSISHLAAEFLHHTRRRLERHDFAPEFRERYSYPASASADIENPYARFERCTCGEAMNDVVGKGGAMPTIVDSRIPGEVNAFAHDLARKYRVEDAV
jgi:hypothetical protein